jgi:hypothetical protein
MHLHPRPEATSSTERQWLSKKTGCSSGQEVPHAAFDSRWVPPVGGAPSRHTSTRGAADGAHDQHLTRGWGVEWCPEAAAKGNS